MAASAAISGAVSGTIVSVCLQPFDVVRTRLQACAAAGRPRTAWSALSEISAEGGAWRLWRGSAATALRVGGGAAIQFSTLQTLRRPRGDAEAAPDATRDAAVGAAARTVAVVCLCPITTAKTRMEASHAGAPTYRSVVDALSTIVRREGPLALVRGLPALLLTNTPFAAIHFAAYEKLRSLGCAAGSSGWALNLVAGGAASVLATVVTQPFDALRARTMLGFGASMTAVRAGGVAGLFAGFLPRLAKRPFQTTLIWALFEDLDGRLQRRAYHGVGGGHTPPKHYIRFTLQGS